MNILKTIKDDYRTLRDGVPGKRFRNYADARRERRDGHFSPSRIVYFAVGILLIVVGLGIGWLPGPGGFLAIIGFAVISQEFPFVADMLDSFERVIRRFFFRMK